MGSILCIGFVAGAATALVWTGAAAETENDRKTLGICIDDPSAVSNGQMVQIFLDWSNANPQYWGSPGFSGVVMALQGQFPC